MKNKRTRREFLKTGALIGTGMIAGANFISCMKSSPKIKGTRLEPASILGGLINEGKSELIQGAYKFVANAPGAGMLFNMAKGQLVGQKYITTDMLLEGTNATNFGIELKEGEDGPAFVFRFSCLNECGLRVRFPLDLVDMNRWGIDREGAFLKPRVSGKRINLENVDRMRFFVNRKGIKPSIFHMTELIVTNEDVPIITDPLLPKGKLLDEIGQSMIHQWPEKTKSVEEMSERLKKQLEDSKNQKWPDRFTKWGGDKTKKLSRGSGFFRTYYDNKRWWLLDPEGYAFWSAGLDCIRVDTEGAYNQLESALTFLPGTDSEYAEIYQPPRKGSSVKLINYLAANFIRTFGKEGWREKWAEIALSEMKKMRFNTVGNWSEYEYAARASFPYTIPMSFKPTRVKLIYRDFPDVFAPQFSTDAEEYASMLKVTANDPALIGYFLMNEPQWAFSSELPAEGMLYNTRECETKKALVEFLKNKYKDDGALSAAWGVQTGFNAIIGDTWKTRFPEGALADLQEFSSIMSEKYFTVISEACRKIDPNHLNLGIRYAGVPPEWAAKSMKSFDVFSINSYTEKVPGNVTERINEMLGMPTIVGEWHFGALDVGLPFSGIGHLKNQKDRAKAYRIYFEDAVANPNCIGVHWFTLYDESAIGRFDGEAYNIGFLDVCNKPYDEMSMAAIQSHERMYDLAVGKIEPFFEKLEYLPLLY